MNHLLVILSVILVRRGVGEDTEVRDHEEEAVVDAVGDIVLDFNEAAFREVGGVNLRSIDKYP